MRAVLTVPKRYEANGPVDAENAIIDIGPIIFDSGTSITLYPYFEVKSNTEFEALIDGCGGL